MAILFMVNLVFSLSLSLVPISSKKNHAVNYNPLPKVISTHLASDDHQVFGSS